MIKKEKEILDYFSRTVDNIYVLEEFKKLLGSGKQIRVKYGVDVTSSDLHIGHAVNLWMMRYLQDLGHKVVFLVGDFTTRIGDPTGKSKLRPIISSAEIKKGEKEFLKQVNKILKMDKSVFELSHNSKWYDKMKVGDFLSLISMVTHSHLIERDMFRERIKNGREIYVHEMVYPILQGYDSLMVDSDLTIIGSDQLFNEMMGRFFQTKFNKTPQIIITTKITPGLSGKEKQSKSLKNYIGLNHSPRDKFGLTMTLPDNLISEYLKVYTDVSLDEIKKREDDFKDNPMEYKIFLAKGIVKRYHSDKVADIEEEWFRSTFQKKKSPTDIPEIGIEIKSYLPTDLLMILKLAKSRSDAGRLIEQGAVEVDGQIINDRKNDIVIKSGFIIRVGKRRFVKIK
jgi:tyrosyl-tRNA synthetase